MQKYYTYYIECLKSWWMITLSFIIYHLSFRPKAAILSFTILSFSGAAAQTWMHHPQANATQQVWFRHDLSLHDVPQQMHLNVASAGRFIVYVNGYHVSKELFSGNADGAVALHVYDVTRFLRSGDNIIGVWYAPAPEGYTTDDAMLRQLNITLAGITADGHHFTMDDSKGWFCRQANARITMGGEFIDGMNYKSSWNTGPLRIMEWLPTACIAEDGRWKTENNSLRVMQWQSDDTHAFYIKRILQRAKVIQQGRTIIYDFGEPVNGWVRVTLRGCKKGEMVEVNGLRYVCTGKTDEQACRRFTTGEAGTARIILPAGRGRSNIARVEAVEIYSK